MPSSHGKIKTSTNFTARLTPKHQFQWGPGHDCHFGGGEVISRLQDGTLHDCRQPPLLQLQRRYVTLSEGFRPTTWTQNLVTAGRGCGVSPASAVETALRKRKGCRGGNANVTALSKGTGETCVRQVRQDSISPEHCNANPDTILENRTKTQVSCATAACSPPTLHVLPGGVWTGPVHAPHWGFWGCWKPVSHCWGAAVPSCTPGASLCSSLRAPTATVGAGEGLGTGRLVGTS